MRDLDLEILVFFIGFFYLLIWTSRWVMVIYRTFLGTECTTERYGKDTWAVITGASGGLGR